MAAAGAPLLKSPARVAPAAVLGRSALMKSLARFALAAALAQAALAGAAPPNSLAPLATVASAMASAPAPRSALVAGLKSCDGCPFRPPADWQCPAPSAPGRWSAGLRFAAGRRDHAPSPRAAAAPREKGRQVQSGWQCQERSGQRMQLVMNPARIPERQLCSVVRRRTQHRVTA